MLEPKIIYNPVKGKTFSLFGKSADTEEYFEIISRISDRFLLEGYEMNDLIYLIRDCSKNKRKLKNENRKSGVLGIACIPELIWGMRKCTTLKIPVVGIPLNANRCTRWMDKFHPNSIDLRQLEKLLN